MLGVHVLTSWQYMGEIIFHFLNLIYGKFLIKYKHHLLVWFVLFSGGSLNVDGCMLYWELGGNAFKYK